MPTNLIARFTMHQFHRLIHLFAASKLRSALLLPNRNRNITTASRECCVAVFSMKKRRLEYRVAGIHGTVIFC